MEDVVSYPIERPSIGDKRLMMELSNAVDFVEAMPMEKRPHGLSLGNNNKSIPTGFERGEKRSASEALVHQPIPKEFTIAEQQEKELVKRVSARALALPREGADAELTVFHGINEPSIGFQLYVERLVHYANVWAREKPGLGSQGVRCALLAIVYLERAGARISSKSIHRLFLIAFLIGIKLTDDFGISNTFWGRAGGCSLEDVNRMEIAFCEQLSWDFGVSPENYESLKKIFLEGL